MAIVTSLMVKSTIFLKDEALLEPPRALQGSLASRSELLRGVVVWRPVGLEPGAPQLYHVVSCYT